MSEAIPRYEPGVVGWVHLGESEISGLVAVIPPNGRYLEIGSASGASAALLADRRPDIRILCVDIFHEDTHEGAGDGFAARSQRWVVNRRRNMNLWVGTVQELAAWIPGPFDVVLVDADHEYEPCLADLRAAAGLVSLDGILAAHDYADCGHPAVTRAVDEFLKAGGWRLDRIVTHTALLRRE